MIRTDSPGETSTRRLAGLKLRMSLSPIVMWRHADHLHKNDIGDDLVNDTPLLVQSGRSMTGPCAGQALVAKSLDRLEARRTGQGDDVLPFFIAFQDFQRYSSSRKILVDGTML